VKPLLLLVLLAACARAGDSIIVAGERVPVGVPVVTWKDEGGYDAYLETCFFDRARVLPRTPAAGCDEPIRYGSRRDLPADIAGTVSASGWTKALLQRQVSQVVVHYDECGTSRRCFEVLQDLRGLSVHFMLDLDGTLYQTLDLQERARHAGSVNDHSIGIEVAHPGPLELHADLAARYRKEGGRTIYEFTGPVRTAGFVAHPARPDPIAGAIHGRSWTIYDFTEEQYRTLTKLLRALSELFPRVRLACPRDASGAVRMEALPKEELGAFEGIIGHFHVTKDKQDPGPAFDWDRVLGQRR
jgi:N-acetylmuramoyl-L-alanine amidase